MSLYLYTEIAFLIFLTFYWFHHFISFIKEQKAIKEKILFDRIFSYTIRNIHNLETDYFHEDKIHNWEDFDNLQNKIIIELKAFYKMMKFREAKK